MSKSTAVPSLGGTESYNSYLLNNFVTFLCNPFVPFMKILDGPMQHVCIHQSHWVPVECLGTLDEHSLVTRRTLCGIGNVHYRLCITQDVGCRLRTMNLLIPIYSHLASSAGKQIQNRFTFNYLLFTWQNIACLHVMGKKKMWQHRTSYKYTLWIWL